MALTKVTTGVISDTTYNSFQSYKNIVINGAMQIAQRNTSYTGITSAGYYTADRFRLGVNDIGTWTMTIDTSGPSGTEFVKSANLVCTTANTLAAGTNYFSIEQKFEGQNLQHLKKGTVNATEITFSFWAKSSNTGTYIVELADADNVRTVSKSYTINTANTWEKKSLTFPADTTGAFDNDNASSLTIISWLAAGPTFTSGTLNTVWSPNSNSIRCPGQTNLANRVGNYYATTGWQLEAGSTSTNFEYRPYPIEFELCQRYCQRWKAYYETSLGTTGTIAGPVVSFSVPMRASPSFTTTEDSGSGATLLSMNSVGSNAFGYYVYYQNLSISTSSYAYRYNGGIATSEL